MSIFSGSKKVLQSLDAVSEKQMSFVTAYQNAIDFVDQKTAPSTPSSDDGLFHRLVHSASCSAAAAGTFFQGSSLLTFASGAIAEATEAFALVEAAEAAGTLAAATAVELEIASGALVIAGYSALALSGALGIAAGVGLVGSMLIHQGSKAEPEAPESSTPKI